VELRGIIFQETTPLFQTWRVVEVVLHLLKNSLVAPSDLKEVAKHFVPAYIDYQNVAPKVEPLRLRGWDHRALLGKGRSG
jgi:hypothetical protein